MNAIGISLVWCMVQVTLLGLLVSVVYVVARWLRPAAAAPVLLSGLAMIVVLSLLAFSPWPRWSWVTSAFWPITATVSSSGQADVAPSGNSTDAAPDPVTEVSVREQESPQPSRPAIGQTLRRLIAEELIAPPPAAFASGWRWPAVAGATLLAAVIFGLGWLVLGMLSVRWQQRSSQPVRDRELIELVDVLCAELCCQRRIEIRQCDNLVTAAMIGWRRPTLLVPPDWRTWSQEERHAVLAHEIVHARGHDCLGMLCGQLALMLHVYHPLLHWLTNRLRLEQELAADAAAASVNGGQRQYLATIAQLALRQPERPVLWPARTFLPTRTAFMRRIAMLRDNKLPVGRPSLAARLSVAGIVLVGGLLVAGLRGPAGHEQAWAAERSKSPAGAQAIKAFNSQDKPITKDGVRIEEGAWRIQGQQNRTVRLFEVPLAGIDDCTLYYRAKMRTEELDGRAYLEMWCRLSSGGEAFSRGLMNPVSGTTGWAHYETPFFLKPGERTDLVKLNVVIEGKGALWIKDVELIRGPLPAGMAAAPAAADDSSSDPSDGARLAQQGWQLFGRGQMADAKNNFEKAVKLAPENAAAWNGLGWGSLHCGDAAQAEKAFKRTLELEPKAAGALNGLGQLYLMQRKYDDAERWLLQAAPQAPAAWYGLTRLYLIQGKFEQAQKWAQKIVDSGQADDGARQLLQAAKDKRLSDALRSRIEPPPTRPAPARKAATGAARVSSAKAVAELPLVNAGMEQGNDSPTGWKQGFPIPGVKYLWDKTSGHGSSKSLCLHKTVARYFPIAEWHQSAPNPKTTSKLRVSVWVKAEKATKGILDVQFLNPDDSAHPRTHQWAAYIGAREADAAPVSHDWTRYAGVIEIPQGTKALGIGLQIYGPGKIWFDDVHAEFVPDTTPKTDALLVQPGDEKNAGAPSKGD